MTVFLLGGTKHQSGTQAYSCFSVLRSCCFRSSVFGRMSGLLSVLLDYYVWGH